MISAPPIKCRRAVGGEKERERESGRGIARGEVVWERGNSVADGGSAVECVLT